MRAARGVVALTLALACAKEEPKPEAKPEAKKAAPEAKAETKEAAPKPEPVVDASGFKAASVAYPSALDDLLDLVPADAKEYVVIRDPGRVVELIGIYVADQVKGLEPLTKLATRDAGSGFKDFVDSYGKVVAELSKTAINLDKGMVAIPEKDMVIYGANDPEALPKMLKVLGATQLPDHCAPVKDAPGYAACADDKANVDALAPGKQGKQHRKQLEATLAGYELDRGNVVGSVEDGFMFAVETPPGSIKLTVGLGDLVAEPAAFLGTGKPKALGVSDPGSAFVWAQLDPKSLQAELAKAPPPLSGLGKTLNGEVYVGGIKGGVPLAGLLGVDDPYPVSGLVDLAGSMLDQVPKELPDGTKLALTVEKVEAAGKTVSALRAVMSGSGNVEQLGELGVEPEVWAFAGGKYAAGGFGAKKDMVPLVAGYEPVGPDKAHLEVLPPALAKALAAGEASVALHLPLDGMQAPTMKKQLAEGLGMMAPGDRGGVPADAFANGVLSLFAPLSSLSIWLTHPAKERVLHVEFGAFADSDSEQDKAARAAILEVTGGADRKATYGSLAAKYGDERYKARAGDSPAALGSAVTGAFFLGAVTTMGVMSFRDFASSSAPPPPAAP